MVYDFWSFLVILTQFTEIPFSLGMLCRHVYLDRWMADRYVGRWMEGEVDGQVDTRIHTHIDNRKIDTPIFKIFFPSTGLTALED